MNQKKIDETKKSMKQISTQHKRSQKNRIKQEKETNQEKSKIKQNEVFFNREFFPFHTSNCFLTTTETLILNRYLLENIINEYTKRI